ncbi:MAG: DNA repair protein RecN [Elusimicrobiaceae bacterium]|nr:DNA repair protein RecN [Elusimicrobiaceae bacterium]
MLKELRVQNFAIISDISLSFAPGLNVFSGETGAGKSIVIEALSFVLGARGDTSLIKDGAEKISVVATFTSAELPQGIRTQYQLTADIFTLKRELDRKGKNKAYIDGRVTTIAALSQIGRYLVDFHGQHEHQSLLHASVHLALLDKFAKNDTLTQQVSHVYQHVQTLEKKLEAARLSAQEKERLLDMSQYQLDEIERVSPAANEDLQLEQDLPKLKHAGRLLENAATAYNELYTAEDSATARVSRAAKEVAAMAELDENIAELSENLNTTLLTLEDIAASLGDYKDSISIEPDALDKMLERHEKIKRLKAKYGPEITDVLRTAQELKERIENLKHAEEHEQDLQNELTKAKKELLTLSQQLHDKRFAAAEKLSARITQQIKPLGFQQVRFSTAVEMDEENITATGADRVEFLFSPNPGQALRPLHHIASGGEISRVMLGLKTVLASTVPVMVFDEVDAGIGGETGWLVGEKLHDCAQGRQVLCITHLAQVAAQADHNFFVSKTVRNNQTHVSIEPLQDKQLPAEISRMLGGNKDTHSAAFEHAKELLQKAGR